MAELNGLDAWFLLDFAYLHNAVLLVASRPQFIYPKQASRESAKCASVAQR